MTRFVKAACGDMNDGSIPIPAFTNQAGLEPNERVVKNFSPFTMN